MPNQSTIFAPARFWSKVDMSGSCWVWIASCAKNGYGAFKMPGKVAYAHRISYELAYGTIPDGLLVCHTCDNKRCVRPEHLFLGTNADNMRDMAQKGRHYSHTKPDRLPTGDRNGARTKPERHARGERGGKAKLTNTDVQAIRSEYDSGGISHAALARRFGVCETSIRNIINRKTWTHI